jgi:hypothetical protein
MKRTCSGFEGMMEGQRDWYGKQFTHMLGQLLLTVLCEGIIESVHVPPLLSSRTCLDSCC